MLLRLALRNVRLGFSRRLVVALVVVVTFAALLVGNTIFQSSEQGIRQTYRDSFTGDASISPASETPYSLFGNDLLIGGDFEALPVFGDPQSLDERLCSSGVNEVTYQVSAQAYLQIDGVQMATPTFGVDFSEYFAFFPALRLTTGQLPAVGSHGLLLNEQRGHDLEQAVGRSLVLGEPVRLVSTNEGGFTIREVPFAGTFAYPVGDDLLDRIVLVDADTARALNGYVSGASRMVTISEQQTRLLDSAPDDLFGESGDVVAEAQQLSLGAVEDRIQTVTGETAATVSGAWNFALVRFAPGQGLGDLAGLGEGVQVRDWKDTAGGNAQLVFFLRVLFNVGMALVVFVGLLVVSNTLALGVSDRTREIGTLRALGATRSFVSQLMVWESVLLVAGAGGVGLVVGVSTLWLLSTSGIPLTNPLLAALFGTTLLRPRVLWDLVGFHLAGAFGLALVASLIPLRLALAVTPVRAMSQEA